MISLLFVVVVIVFACYIIFRRIMPASSAGTVKASAADATVSGTKYNNCIVSVIFHSDYADSDIFEIAMNEAIESATDTVNASSGTISSIDFMDTANAIYIITRYLDGTKKKPKKLSSKNSDKFQMVKD